MINELDKIDFMKLDEDDNSKLVLAITDHLEWGWSVKSMHLLMLQEKLNNYVNYILEELYKEQYEEEISSFQIIVFAAHQPPKKFHKLLAFFNEKIKKEIPEHQIEITYQFVEPDEDE